jgi:hypothetical protein
MKKKPIHTERILGRRLAQELSREAIKKVTGGADPCMATQTFTYPPDRDKIC